MSVPEVRVDNMSTEGLGLTLRCIQEFKIHRGDTVDISLMTGDGAIRVPGNIVHYRQIEDTRQFRIGVRLRLEFAGVLTRQRYANLLKVLDEAQPQDLLQETAPSDPDVVADRAMAALDSL